VLDGDSAPPLQKGDGTPRPQIFGPCLLWPNCWMHQDATCYGGRPQPRRLCIRLGNPAPSPKRGGAPNFRPTCVDQDATWYGGRPRPMRHCVRWGPIFPPLKGHSPQFSAHVYCGQTAGCIKMPLGMEVGLSPVDFVLDGDPAAPPQKGAEPPIFGPCLLRPNGCIDEDATWYRVRPRSSRHRVR